MSIHRVRIAIIQLLNTVLLHSVFLSLSLSQPRHLPANLAEGVNPFGHSGAGIHLPDLLGRKFLPSGEAVDVILYQHRIMVDQDTDVSGFGTLLYLLLHQLRPASHLAQAQLRFGDQVQDPIHVLPLLGIQLLGVGGDEVPDGLIGAASLLLVPVCSLTLRRRKPSLQRVWQMDLRGYMQGQRNFSTFSSLVTYSDRRPSDLLMIVVPGRGRKGRLYTVRSAQIIVEWPMGTLTVLPRAKVGGNLEEEGGGPGTLEGGICR